ncbi:hypothetical protein LEP1GSC021_3505 [Leptospira noguchii str. 1993005606]|nr:hypothetical protein LEP1GSC021_3505 [Leptospira noguchii str. 1993005606]
MTINKIVSIDRFHKTETKWRIHFSTTLINTKDKKYKSGNVLR